MHSPGADGIAVLPYAIAVVYREHKAIPVFIDTWVGPKFLSNKFAFYDHRRRNSGLGLFKVYLQPRNTSELAHYTTLENMLVLFQE